MTTALVAMTAMSAHAVDGEFDSLSAGNLNADSANFNNLQAGTWNVPAILQDHDNRLVDYDGRTRDTNDAVSDLEDAVDTLESNAGIRDGLLTGIERDTDANTTGLNSLSNRVTNNANATRQTFDQVREITDDLQSDIDAQVRANGFQSTAIDQNRSDIAELRATGAGQDGADGQDGARCHWCNRCYWSYWSHRCCWCGRSRCSYQC